ncbi:MAG: ABC transporter ATP-binding protein [SAR324 cluster bacterium]|nr:ABC transporter ATP-binding protein [SAR324 cluster bacterium]
MHHKYDKRECSNWILNEINLKIENGELLGLLGPSGCGKTTLLRLIAGFEYPSKGRISLNDKEISSRKKILSPEKRNIGMVFQDPLTSLNPLFRIGEQLIETLQTHADLDEKSARKQAIDWLAEVGIPSPEVRIDQYPHQFSGGMRQRVVIALALCANPKLIIADEPTTALDVSIQAQIISLLKRLCREHGTAVMLITHDMGVIAETADRVAVMYAGRLVEIGEARKVIQNAKHPYTLGLMGSIPTIGDTEEDLRQIQGSMPRLAEIPQGCAFNPRCPNVRDLCRKNRPELQSVSESSVACWLFEDQTVSSEIRQ